MKKKLHSLHFIKNATKTLFVLLFLFSYSIGLTQTITPTKTISSSQGVCGALDVELKIVGSNPISRPMEVVLVIDISGSMGQGNNPKPISFAQDAATDFINKMFDPVNNPTGKNKVALVTYRGVATLRQGLTLSTGKTDLINIINGIAANGDTNIQDALVKANTELTTNGTYDCATSRSIVLMTDGVATRIGPGGTGCTPGQQGTCIQSAITEANNAKTITKSGVVYNNQIFTVGLFGAISGGAQTNAEYTLNQIQSAGSFFTENAANLTGIYSQIFSQLSWVAKQTTSASFAKEIVDPNFTIGNITASKGIATLSGQEISWNLDFLNVETITLKYKLTPKPNVCGSQKVSSTRLDYEDSNCVKDNSDIASTFTDVPCPILTLASQTNVTCINQNNGTITLNAPTSGQSPFTYQWTKNNVNYATTKDLTGLGIGSYKVIATDKNGCATSALTVVITQPTVALALAASTKIDITCFGTSTGTVKAGEVTNAAGTITYSWKNATGTVVGTTETVTNLPAGTYTVTVTDSCSSKNNSVTIIQPADTLTLAASTKTNITCFGTSTGTVKAGTVTNAVGTVTYSWKNAAGTLVGTTETVTNLPAGTYTVTVTDSCSSKNNSVTIIQPADTLTLAASTKTDVTCFGASTGTVKAGAVTNAVGTVTYSWKNATGTIVGTTETVNNLPAGNYTVTVTDSCSSKNNSVTITQPTAALALAASTKTDITCFSTSTGTVKAGAVTNAVGSVTYSWKNATGTIVGTTETVNNLSAGTYTVTVTDSCSSQSNSVTITQPTSALVLAASTKTDITCFGTSTGTVKAGTVTNAVGTVTYSWKNATGTIVGTTETVNNLSAGTYTVTVTDSCSSKNNSVTITQPADALTLAASTKTDITCFGTSTGTVKAGTVTNAVGTVTYSWKNATGTLVGTTETVNNLPVGTYTVTVTDSCSSKNNSVTITQPTAALVLAASTKTDISCFGASTGTVKAGTATNAVGTVTYSWKNATGTIVGTTETVNNLPAGTYTVTVTDSCSSKNNSVTITQPADALTLAASTKTDITCFGTSTGTVKAGTVTNAVGTVTYSWKNAAGIVVGTTETVNNLPAGTYTVTVTDSCSSKNNSVTITQPADALTLAASTKTDITCFGTSTGTVKAGTVTNAVGTITYSWKNAAGTIVGTTETVNNLPAGTYTVTVTDSCSSQSNSVTITQPAAALALAASTKTDITCFGASTGTVKAGTVTNAVGTVTYSWKNATGPIVGTTETVNNLSAGTYTVTVTDSCSSKNNSVTITQPADGLTLAASTKVDITCFGTNTGTVKAGTVTNAVGTVTYSWKNATGIVVGTTETVANLPAGTYTVTVTDSCSSKNNSVTIIQPSLIVVTPSQTNVSCKGGTTGTATVVVTGGTGLYTYSWSPSGGTAATASNLTAGTYTVTINDANNCSTTAEFIITDGDAIKPIIDPLPATSTINCPAEPVFAKATATDNNGTITSLTFVDTITQGNCKGAYSVTRTWTAVDACNNVSLPVSQTIIVEDNSKPTWSTAINSLNTTIECSNQEALATAQALFPIAADTCDTDVTNLVKTSGNFVASQACSTSGTYTNTWNVSDECGNISDTFTQIITIQDTTNPIFNGVLPTDITVSCDAVPAPATLEASDNCNEDLPIVFKETKGDIQNECDTNYTLTRTWSTSDCAGNLASHTQIITVRDTTPPTGTAPANSTDLTSIADIPAASSGDIKDAADNCSKVVTITSVDTNNGGSGCEGNAYILTRTYTLTDCAGNKTDLVQTFTVENKVTVTAVPSNVSCFEGNDGLLLVTNSPGSTVTVTNAKNEVVGESNLPAGIYTVTAKSTVNSGDQSCTATTTVEIKQPDYKVKISGQILNIENNTPLANVSVKLIPQNPTTGTELVSVTDAEGLYNFTGMVAGNYLVQVQDANLLADALLIPVDSNSFATTLQDCNFQVHDFKYKKSIPAVIVATDDNYSNISCNTFGLVGNVLSNDLVNQDPATLQIVNFTLLETSTNAKTDPNITIDASGNVTVTSSTPAGTYVYSYQICEKLHPTNCDTATVTITVAPNSIVTIPGSACNADSTLVDLSSLLPVNTPTTGTWIDQNNTNALQGNMLNAFGLALGNYTFEYKIADENCPRSILLNMTIDDDCKVLACENVVIHNAFSPNGDGVNDFFKIDNIDQSECYPENTVEIYNRWGILVFQTENYNNKTNAFDGFSRGRTTISVSDGLPTGTYFYIITYKSLGSNNEIKSNKKDGYLYLSR